MIDRNAVLPAAWNALVNALCKEAPHLQNTLAPDVARFSRTKATPGGLSAAFTTSLLGYNGSPLEFTVSSAKPQGLACTLDPFYRAMRSAAAPAPLSDTVRRSPRPRSPIPLTAWRRCDVCNVQAFSRCASAPGWGENTPRTRSKPRSTLKPRGHGGRTRWLARAAHRRGRRAAGLTLLMVGYYPESADSPREYYYQWHSARITRDDILAVMRLFEGESRFSALMPLLDRALRQQDRRDFPDHLRIQSGIRAGRQSGEFYAVCHGGKFFRRQPPRFRRYHRAAGARWPSHAAA